MEDIIKTNDERKVELWNRLLPKYKHLENYCTITVRELETDSPYFHPTFTIDDNINITGQCDLGNNYMYALRVNIKTYTGSFVSVDISDSLLDSVILGYHTNKDVVIIALTTLQKVKNHINSLDIYLNDYISNTLIGNSVKDITTQIKAELDMTEGIISFIHKNK
jgi:hypothetical protein